MSGEKTKIGIIGAGWWAIDNHLPILKAAPDVELRGVCRLGREELEDIVSRFGFAFGTEDYRELLEDKEMDGVIVASPHHFHAEHAIAALQAGYHVLVEKPASVNLGEALALRKAASESGKQLLVPHGWNWRAYSTTARDWIADGKLGAIRHLSLQMGSPAEDLFTGHGWTGAASAHFAPDPKTWSDPAASGGYAWGQLPHLLGLLFLTVPDLEPDRVFGQMRAGPTGSDLFDAGVLRFNGAILASISGAATVPPQAPFQIDIRIFGTDGMILIDLAGERVELWRNDGERAAHPLTPGEGGYICREPVEAFIELCRGKQVENRADADLALKCTRIIEGLYISASSGKAVQVGGDRIIEGAF